MGNQQNAKQQTALATAVLAYAEHIDNPSVLLPAVKHIGQNTVVSIFEVLGDAATGELIEAWKVAYFQLADLMIGIEKEMYDQMIQTKVAGQEGKQLELTAPTGSFNLIENGHPHVFISGGVGQTPLMAMLEQLIKTKGQNPVTWIHGCRNSDLHAFKDRLRTLEVQHEHIRCFSFYDELQESNSGISRAG
ncbi:oxidoreductase NAD-binding domain-containing protein [Ditylenchus destructor]|uniref:Oxidoreductase NAD-binding domain-containing protein n=1 Tax=Ditylenchus destructor TaxID=166010 RepID=A0AAD4MFN7_9BILA|nr:oxidoreductase NAD-binding domain-containing protein [Ditylenchus destructor]